MNSSKLDKPTIQSRQTTIVCGVVALEAWLYLASISRDYGSVNLIQFLSISAFISLVSAYLWWLHTRNRITISLVDVLGFAIAFRLVGLFTFPVLEDDFYRFLWDGYRTAVAGTPYGIAPSTFFGTDVPDNFEAILDGINYPDVPTIYGPTNQWLFYLAHLISPSSIWPLKMLLMFADLIIILLLVGRVPTKVLMLYSWSPLVLKEFVISVHPDIWGVLFMVLALHAYTTRRDYLLGTMLALAVGVKLFAMVIFPFLVLWRWKAWASFTATAALIALPFGIQEAWLPEGLDAMSSNWVFNAPLYELFSTVFSIEFAKIILLSSFVITGAIYGAVWAIKIWRLNKIDNRPIPRADLLFALLFICIPVFNPWYAIWLIPFALLWPSFWIWVGSISLLLSYASGINLATEAYPSIADYQHPNWVMVVEFGVIAFAFFCSQLALFDRILRRISVK